MHGCPAAACLTPFETKIWSRDPLPSRLPSSSCQATHGTGSAPATAAPPTTAGSSASRSVLMLSDGTCGARACPSGTHVFAAEHAALTAAQKRLAKTCSFPPSGALGSYQASHGTVRPAPAKSIDGASASTVLSMLRAGPCVTHCPFLKARTKMSCALPDLCSNVAHGSRAAPAREPPVTSDTPALWAGSIPAAGSALTWVPFAGRATNAAYPVAAAPRTAAAATAATRTEGKRLIGGLLSCGCGVRSRECGPSARMYVRPPPPGRRGAAPLRRRSGAGRGLPSAERPGALAPGSWSGREDGGPHGPHARDERPRHGRLSRLRADIRVP